MTRDEAMKAYEAALPWLWFYRDRKTLQAIAVELGCSLYDLSPWLYAPMLADGLRKDAQAVEIDRLKAEVDRLNGLLNSPELHDFGKAVVLEAAHQQARWDDEKKEPPDWFWLVGYLAGKALASAITGRADKALHHVVTTAAACANWHRVLKANRAERG